MKDHLTGAGLTGADAATCGTCHGSGFVEDGVVMACCGHADPSGECCGNGVPEENTAPCECVRAAANTSEKGDSK